MIRVEIFEKVEHEWWNSLVRSVPEGNIYQTTHWADYLKKSGKGEPYYLAFYDKTGAPVCLLIVCFENKLDKINNIPRPVRNKYGFSYAGWLNGPLILQNGLSRAALFQIVCEIEELCVKKNAIAIRNITLPLGYGVSSGIYGDLEGVLTERHFCSKRWETPFIDLSFGEESIWGSFKRDTKKDIKRGSRDSLSVIELEKKDLAQYEHLLAENMRRNKMPMPPHYPDKAMWDALKRDGNDSLRVLSAQKDGRLLAVLGLIEYNGIILQFGSAQSDDAYLKKLNANDLITWEAILWGINSNKRVYDLTGMPPVPSNKREEGIKRYKLKWSDKVIAYNVYSKVYKRNLHSFLTVLNKAHNTIARWI